MALIGRGTLESHLPLSIPGVRPIALPDQCTADANSSAGKPHVLLVLDQIAATLGGGERVVLRLARHLPARGYRVSILTFAVDPSSPALADPPCPVYLLPLRRTWDLHALRSARRLRQFLREQQVDIVQTFFESSDLWAGAVAKTVPHIRLIWSRRDMGILRTAKHRILYRLLRHMPDRVLAVSEEVRQYCIQVDGIAPGRVETLHNGIDIPEDIGTTATRDSHLVRTIVSVGNVRHVKGFDVLLEAAATVLKKFPKTVFKIAGEVLNNDYHAGMIARAEALGITANFQFLGNVRDIASLLQTADIFVLPSRSEGFSNAIVEAMALSLPVVATRVGGNAEAVEDGGTGLLIPSGDHVALAEALSALLAHPEQGRAMGIAGRARALANFTTDAMMSRQAEVYRLVLSAVSRSA